MGLIIFHEFAHGIYWNYETGLHSKYVSSSRFDSQGETLVRGAENPFNVQHDLDDHQPRRVALHDLRVNDQECDLHRTHEAISQTAVARDLLDGRKLSGPHRSAVVKIFVADKQSVCG